MKLKHAAAAGTLESSDAQVMIEPCEGETELYIESTVLNQYGEEIKAVLLETLERLEVTNAKVRVIDKGALDCTLKARIECAVYRACDKTEALPWGGAIR